MKADVVQNSRVEVVHMKSSAVEVEITTTQHQPYLQREWL